MKRIFLDLGNTRYKWICSDALTQGAVTFRTYSAADPELDVAQSMRQACEKSRLIIASVKGDTFNQRLTAHLEKMQLAQQWVTLGDSPLIRPAYVDWSQFGIDRYLNLVAAKQACDCPLLVISAGTAVTLDLLDSAGSHAGGCIFPGRSLLQQSLSGGTARIQNVAHRHESKAKSSVLAKSTTEGVAAGIQSGFVGAIDHIATEMQKEIRSNVTVLLTGGDAESLNQALTLPNKVDSLLLFRGMDKVSQPKP